MFTQKEIARLNKASIKVCPDSIPVQAYWTVDNEISYVKNILARRLGSDRKAIIEGYIKGLKKRKDFNEHEKGRILWYANQRLMECKSC